jgi:hypothetical protein
MRERELIGLTIGAVVAGSATCSKTAPISSSENSSAPTSGSLLSTTNFGGLRFFMALQIIISRRPHFSDPRNLAPYLTRTAQLTAPAVVTMDKLLLQDWKE